MRYCKRINIWRAMEQTLAVMQPGQHVSAGDARGVWAGMTRAGIRVVMWEKDTSKGHRADYFRSLRNYARAHA